MKQIDMIVSDMSLEIKGEQKGIVRGTDNYLVLRFIFDRAWRDRRKVVHMEDVEGNSYNCIVGKDSKVKIPRDVTGTSRIYIKVYGKEDSVTVSTNTVVIEQE